MKRTPLKPGKGFKKPERPPKVPALLRPLPKPPNYSVAVLTPAPKEPPPVRSKKFRRMVAQLPCFYCRIESYSQAAHPNAGKAKGKKLSDDKCFPMCCDRPGVVGCHTLYDQHKLIPVDMEAKFEAEAHEWTIKMLVERGLVPNIPAQWAYVKNFT